MGLIRIVSPDILKNSAVCYILRDGKRYPFLLWEESYEDYLLENNGWYLERTVIPVRKFIRFDGIKLLSDPFWTCKCKIGYLKIKGVKSYCRICGKSYPYQKKNFHTVKSFFGWDNVHMFRPKEIPFEDEIEEEKEE